MGAAELRSTLTVIRALYWTIATAGGLGLSPVAPGTMGTLGGVFLYLLLSRSSFPLYFFTLFVVILAGIWSAERVGRETGKKDSQKIVIDEVAGLLVTLLAASGSLFSVILGFLFFRLFDIWKPFPIRWSEGYFPGGLGVMIDDLMAGGYACLGLWIFERWVL
ncbi:MAG: phosphatidylglycerophosphatase A [Deltaproteobacteria bacterium]|nr:phosphatidylglycerophosphatase A [Deltaproteobacteria bacterium]